MSPNDIPYVYPPKRDLQWLAWQAQFQRDICAMFGLSAEEIYGHPTREQQTDLERALHGAGAPDGETE